MKNVIAKFLARRLGDDWGPRSPLRFAVGRLREYKLMALGVVILSVMTAAFEGGSLALIMLGVQVLVTQKVADSFATLGRMGNWILPFFEGRSTVAVFVILVLTAVLIQVLRSTSTYAQSVAGVYLQNRVARRSIFRAYERVLSLDFSTIIRQKGGEVSYKTTAMPNLAQVIQQLINALQGLTMMLGYTVLLLVIAPFFALVVVVGAVLLNYVMGFAQRAVRRHAERYTRIQQETTQVGAEMFQSFRLVHTHATWERTARELKSLIAQAYLSRRKFEVVSASVGPIFEVILITSVAAILIGTVLLNNTGKAQAFSGTLVSLLIVYRAMPWANTLNHVRTALAQSLPPLAYAAALFNDPDLTFRPVGLPEIVGPADEITFEHVCYRYPETEAEVLNNVSFDIRRGKCIALVGASGSGKSTLTDLLIGLREPTSGVIRINGRDLRQIDPASWRARLGVVSQDTFLFNMSLRDNIIYGMDLDETLLRRVGRLAHVEEFVRELPDGYDTVVGDRGYRLSGGQRQRLALARALYRQPEVLVLDEATSALDSASERVVQAAIEESIGEGMTTVIVAHRLSTIAHADEILVLDHGSVIERGDHATLIESDGAYARLWSIQCLAETPALSITG